MPLLEELNPKNNSAASKIAPNNEPKMVRLPIRFSPQQ